MEKPLILGKPPGPWTNAGVPLGWIPLLARASTDRVRIEALEAEPLLGEAEPH